MKDTAVQKSVHIVSAWALDLVTLSDPSLISEYCTGLSFVYQRPNNLKVISARALLRSNGSFFLKTWQHILNFCFLSTQAALAERDSSGWDTVLVIGWWLVQIPGVAECFQGLTH